MDNLDAMTPDEMVDRRPFLKTLAHVLLEVPVDQD